MAPRAAKIHKTKSSASKKAREAKHSSPSKLPNSKPSTQARVPCDRFTDMPPELRFEVYDYLALDGNSVVINDNTLSGPGLLLVSKFLQQEHMDYCLKKLPRRYTLQLKGREQYHIDFACPVLPKAVKKITLQIRLEIQPHLEWTQVDRQLHQERSFEYTDWQLRLFAKSFRSMRHVEKLVIELRAFDLYQPDRYVNVYDRGRMWQDMINVCTTELKKVRNLKEYSIRGDAYMDRDPYEASTPNGQSVCHGKRDDEGDWTVVAGENEDFLNAMNVNDEAWAGPEEDWDKMDEVIVMDDDWDERAVKEMKRSYGIEVSEDEDEVESGDEDEEESDNEGEGQAGSGSGEELVEEDEEVTTHGDSMEVE